MRAIADTSTQSFAASEVTEFAPWLLALAVLLLGGALWSILQFPLNQDIAWPLYIADRARAGATPYADLFEVNPPLILFIARGVAALAGSLPVDAGQLHALMVAGLVVGSVAVSARVIDPEDRAALVLFGLLVLLTMPGFDFGQREHIALALVLPWLLTPRSQPLLTGTMAGLGLAMKPHFVIVWIAVEAVRTRREGWSILLRTQNAVIAGVLIGYAAAVILFLPEYLALVRLLAPAYFEFNGQGIFAIPSLLRLVTVALLVVSVRAWPDLRAGAAGFAAAALLQGKGWVYHWLPAVAIALLVALLVLDRRLRHRPLLRMAWAATAVLAGLMLLEFSRARMNELDRGPWHLPQMLAVVERTTGPVLVLSHAQQAAYPLIYVAGRESASRFPSLWPLGVLYEDVEPLAYRAPAAMSPLERFVFDTTVEDLLGRRPELLIVDRAPAAGVVDGFDYLGYLAQDPRVGAVLTHDYTFDSRVGGRYDLYIRRTAGEAGAPRGDR